MQKKALKPGMGVRDMKFEIHCDFKATFSVPMLGRVVVMSKGVLDVEGVKTGYVLGVVPRLLGEAPDVVTNVFVMLPPDSERARFCYDMVLDLREPPRQAAPDTGAEDRTRTSFCNHGSTRGACPFGELFNVPL